MDCADPLEPGEFWAAMLGREIAFSSATTVGADRWRVLLDPAGHPFCLTTQIPPDAR
jgi:hypothetical protein